MMVKCNTRRSFDGIDDAQPLQPQQLVGFFLNFELIFNFLTTMEILISHWLSRVDIQFATILHLSHAITGSQMVSPRY